MSMWKEAVQVLVAVAPKLAYKSELIQALEASTKLEKPPAVLMQQLEVILAVAKQNERVADLHGYTGLLQYSQEVVAATTDVIVALKNGGVKATDHPHAKLT